MRSVTSVLMNSKLSSDTARRFASRCDSRIGSVDGVAAGRFECERVGTTSGSGLANVTKSRLGMSSA